MAQIQLGPFTLLHSVDRGGMAEVWKGVHRDRRIHVAVKVLTGPDSTHPSFLAAFRNEIRAMAGLDHPNILQVYDHGLIDEEVETLSEGRLKTGNPYFVMEWAGGGSLAVGARPRNWKALRVALSALLDALSHAHARGVIHRDLKRQNVLMCDATDMRPGWKLADFGMARPPGTEADPLAGGTPGLMAAEQELGRWRDQGPWTDLYALGRLTWALVSGKRASSAPEPHELRSAPPTETVIAVPKEFWPWLARITEPTWVDRLHFAAHARSWLMSMPDPPHDPDMEAIDDGEDPSREVTGGEARTQVLVVQPPRSRQVSSTTEREVPRPPLPVDWRERRPAEPPVHFNGAGLSLFGLRKLPMVGREAERDRLWEGLCSVTTSGTPRAVIVRGPAGIGKSRIARWLCSRAHELGGAFALHGLAAETPGPVHGVGPMIARYLRCTGLTPAEIQQRLLELYSLRALPDAADIPSLVDLLSPIDPAGDPLPPDRRRAGLEAARRVLTRHALDAPRVVWLDDVQWDIAALDFAARLMETAAPIYVVLCVREDVLATRPDVAERLVQLARLPDVRTVDVAPLTGEAWRSLVRELLGLEPALAQQLAERAGGNPLYAVHLVGHWVSRGMLVTGRTGFRLAPRLSVEIPEDLHAVWAAQLDGALAGRPEPERVSLELAAVLGSDVSVPEWRAVCERAGLPVPLALVESLVPRRLVRSGTLGTSVRWGFVHAMVRESLIRTARNAGRLPQLHAWCAAMLQARGDHPILRERRGRHHLAAGDAAAAIIDLVAAARARLDAEDADQAAVLVGEAGRALDLAAAAAEPRAAVELRLLRANLALRRGDVLDAEAHARPSEAEARRHGWWDLHARALLTLGLSLWEQGYAVDALGNFELALALPELTVEASVRVRCLEATGRVLIALGEPQRAIERISLAEGRFRDLGEPGGVASCLLDLAEAARQLGDYERAAAAARTALGHVEAWDLRGLRVAALVQLSSISRMNRDLDTAETWARAATDRAISGDARQRLAAEVNQALVAVERGQFVAARPPLERNLEYLIRAGSRIAAARLHVFLLPCLAVADEWEEVDRHLGQAQALSGGSGLTDIDVATMAATTARFAFAAGHTDRGRRIARLAKANPANEPDGRPGPR